MWFFICFAVLNCPSLPHHNNVGEFTDSFYGQFLKLQLQILLLLLFQHHQTFFFSQTDRQSTHSCIIMYWGIKGGKCIELKYCKWNHTDCGKLWYCVLTTFGESYQNHSIAQNVSDTVKTHTENKNKKQKQKTVFSCSDTSS